MNNLRKIHEKTERKEEEKTYESKFLIDIWNALCYTVNIIRKGILADSAV